MPDTKFESSWTIWSAILAILLLKVFSGIVTFQVCGILLAQSTPSRTVLGTVNGINQMFGSLSRALGPALAGYLYAYGLGLGKPERVWKWWFSLFALVVWIGTLFMRDEDLLD
jgi:MFS family permease